MIMFRIREFKENGSFSYGRVVFAKLIGVVGVSVDMSLAAFAVCACVSSGFGKWRSEKRGSGCCGMELDTIADDGRSNSRANQETIQV